MELADKETLEKAIEYSKSNRGFTTDQNTGEMIDTEERSIIEGLLRCVLYLMSE